MPKIIDHDERRARLAAAALNVIRRGGVDAATIRGIAAEAGWSRGVVEHYFGSRDELLSFCYRHALAAAFPEFDRLREIDDPRERLVRALVIGLPSDENTRLDNELWLDFLGRLRGNLALRQTLAEVNDEWIARIGELVQQCADDDRYVVTHDLPTCAQLLSHFVDGASVSAALYPEQASAEQQLILARAMVDGIVVPRAASETPGARP